MYYLAKASILSIKGFYSQACEMYDKAIALNPENLQIHINVGYTLTELGKNDLALQSFLKASEIDRENGDAFFGMGLVFLNLRHFKLAIDNFSRAININPKDARSYMYRGITYYETGDLKLSLIDYSKAVSIESEYVDKFKISKKKDKFNLIRVDYFKSIDIYLDDNKNLLIYL